MKTVFVAVNGFPRSGKDSFVDFCITHLENTGNYGTKYSTITTCMQMAEIAGWDGSKSSANRTMLSELKDWYTKHFDGTFNEMVEEIKGNLDLHDDGTSVIFAMIREPTEINKIITWCKDNSVPHHAVLVLSNRGEEHHGSHSDQNIPAYDYTDKIFNNEELHQLNVTAKTFVEGLVS